MRICILARVLNQNSGARAPIRLAQLLAQKGNQVDFYATSFRLDSALLTKMEQENIQVHLMTLPNLRAIDNLIGGWKIFQAVRRGNYDVISAHVHTAWVVAAKLGGGKIVRTYYGTQLSQRTIASQAGLKTNSTPTAIIKAFFWDLLVKLEERISFFCSDRNLTISQYLQKEHEGLYGKKLANIYLGAESSIFNTESLKGQSKPSAKITILSVSRIVPYKGFDLLIKAFLENYKKYKNIQLNIVGSNPDKTYLGYLNKIKNDQVSIIQNPTDQELLEYYRQCDIYASGDLWVPWSLTPLEASFLAKPLIGFNRGAMSEIVEDGVNGFLAEDFKDLTEGLERLIGDQKLREKMGQQAREKVIKKFNWEKTANQYLEIFSKVS